MFTTYGALIGLFLAIVLIVRKVTPVYALVLGAIAGGLIGGGSLVKTVEAMISGTQAMMPSVLRILASGVLVGALVKTGSVAKIADAIVTGLGARFALAAVALATMVICAVGVFIDISVITVAPVALAVGRRAGVPTPALLLAMIGGGKAGNIISPNPNTIAVADAFKVDLSQLMMTNALPALAALLGTIVLAHVLCRGKQDASAAEEAGGEIAKGPSLMQALLGPLTVVILLALRPFAKITIDPLVALPAGGLVSMIVCGKWRKMVEFAEFGLGKVAGIAILLIGTGTVAGIVKASGLNVDMIAFLETLKLPMVALAPGSGVVMAAATASTTAGATIAAQTFSGALLEAGIPALAAAAMVHAGATVADSLPHGSFFHATGGSVFMSVKDRLKLIPFEIAIGLVSTVVSVWVH